MKGKNRTMDNTELERFDEGTGEITGEVVNVSAIGAINRSEVECQLDAAHKYPRFTARRGVQQWSNEVKTLATTTRAIAESCIYTLPRKDKNGKPKPIVGQSIRFAEIIASTWGNLHVASRIVAVEGGIVVSQGGAWDLERNLRTTTEVRRNILTRNGQRYSEDMITVTGNAAAAIARRNAIFAVVPKAYRDPIFEQVRSVAAGTAKELETRRAEVIDRLVALGAKRENICPAIGVATVADIGLDQLTILIGLGTAIKDGGTTIDVAFPDPVQDAPSPGPDAEGRKMKLGKQVTIECGDQPAEPKNPEPGSDG
jgi:hypothetical protein